MSEKREYSLRPRNTPNFKSVRDREIPVYIYTPSKRRQIFNENPFKSTTSLNRSLVHYEQKDLTNLNNSIEEILYEKTEDLNKTLEDNKSLNEDFEEQENLTQVVNLLSKSSVLIDVDEHETHDKYETFYDSIPALVDVDVSNEVNILDLSAVTSTPKAQHEYLDTFCKDFTSPLKSLFTEEARFNEYFNTSSKPPVLPHKSLFTEEARFNEFEKETILINQLTFANDFTEFVNLGIFFDMSQTFDISSFHKSIPEYEGKVDTLNRFIACCEIYVSNLGTDELKATFLKSLVRKFVGRGFDFYNKKTWVSWSELKNSLKQYFSPTQTFEGYQIELCKSKQDNLSVREFGEKIEKILVEINKISNDIQINGTGGGDFFKIQNEKLAIKAFLNGLNEPLKTILRSRKYNQIGESIKDAIEIENEENLNKMQSMTIESKSIQKNDMNVNKNEKTQFNNENRFMPDSVRPNFNRIVCFKCNAFGHLAKNCFRNQWFPQNRPNNYQSRPNYSSSNFSNQGNYNGFSRNAPFSNFSRPSYFERNQNQQKTDKSFGQPRSNYNYFMKKPNDYVQTNNQNNERNFSQNRSNGNGFYNRNSLGQNQQNAYRQYDNNRSNGFNSFNQNKNRFRNEPNQNMQNFSQSKNVMIQSPPMDSVALDFHTN